MSACPATSLVKLDSVKVIELAGETIIRIDRERARRRENLELQIDACIAARRASRWAWLLGPLTRQMAIDLLNIGWDLQLVDAHKGDSRETAVRLIRAANLAPEVLVSISDLWAVS